MQYCIIFIDEVLKPICAYNCNKFDEKSARFTRVQKNNEGFTFSELFSIRNVKPNDRKEIFTALNLIEPTTSKPTEPTSNPPCVNQPLPEIMNPAQHDSSIDSIKNLIIDESQNSSKMTLRSRANNSKPTEETLLRRRPRGKEVDYEQLVEHKRGEYAPTWSTRKPKSDTEFRNYCKNILN